MEHSGRTTGAENKRIRLLAFIWRNLPRFALLAVILFILVLRAVIGSEKERLVEEKAAATAQEARPINVVLLDLQPATLRDAINLPGIIEPWTRLELMAKISGTVTEVLVREGDHVERGRVLARIEEDDYRIAVDAARASHSLAVSQYDRGKLMLEKKSIPQAELDRLASQLHTSRAALEDAELKLSRCTIKAPMQGVIRRLDAKVGLLLSVGDPIAQILEIDRVKALVGIPETDVNAVRDIDEVDITIQALADRKITGRKHFLAPSPETTARLYRLELELPNPDGDILPGMFFRADLVKKTVTDALSVPLYTIISRNDEQFVFTVTDGVVHKKPVRLGFIERWQVQVTDGLAPGDQVVVEGHRDIEEGQQVKVIHVIDDPAGLTL